MTFKSASKLPDGKSRSVEKLIDCISFSTTTRKDTGTKSLTVKIGFNITKVMFLKDGEKIDFLYDLDSGEGLLKKVLSKECGIKMRRDSKKNLRGRFKGTIVIKEDMPYPNSMVHINRDNITSSRGEFMFDLPDEMLVNSKSEDID